MGKCTTVIEGLELNSTRETVPCFNLCITNTALLSAHQQVNTHTRSSSCRRLTVRKKKKRFRNTPIKEKGFKKSIIIIKLKCNKASFSPIQGICYTCFHQASGAFKAVLGFRGPIYPKCWAEICEKLIWKRHSKLLIGWTPYGLYIQLSEPRHISARLMGGLSLINTGWSCLGLALLSTTYRCSCPAPRIMPGDVGQRWFS